MAKLRQNNIGKGQNAKTVRKIISIMYVVRVRIICTMYIRIGTMVGRCSVTEWSNSDEIIQRIQYVLRCTCFERVISCMRRCMCVLSRGSIIFRVRNRHFRTNRDLIRIWWKFIFDDWHISMVYSSRANARTRKLTGACTHRLHNVFYDECTRFFEK